jgi:hypothetical protein
MQLGLVDETRKMDVATQLLVGTPRIRLSLQLRS